LVPSRATKIVCARLESGLLVRQKASAAEGFFPLALRNELPQLKRSCMNWRSCAVNILPLKASHDYCELR